MSEPSDTAAANIRAMAKAWRTLPSEPTAVDLPSPLLLGLKALAERAEVTFDDALACVLSGSSPHFFLRCKSLWHEHLQKRAEGGEA